MLTALLVREVELEIGLVTILCLFKKKYSLKYSGMLTYFRVSSVIIKGRSKGLPCYPLVIRGSGS